MGTPIWHPGKRPNLQTQVWESLSHGSELWPRRAGGREEHGGRRTEPGGVRDGRQGTQVNQQIAKSSRAGEVNGSLGSQEREDVGSQQAKLGRRTFWRLA